MGVGTYTNGFMGGWFERLDASFTRMIMQVRVLHRLPTFNMDRQMSRKAHLPVEIKLNAPNGIEYWKRIDWCCDNIGKQMGSDDLLPLGKWFHFTDGMDHVFCFANDDLAAKFSMRFVFKFLD